MLSSMSDFSLSVNFSCARKKLISRRKERRFAFHPSRSRIHTLELHTHFASTLQLLERWFWNEIKLDMFSKNVQGKNRKSIRCWWLLSEWKNSKRDRRYLRGVRQIGEISLILKSPHKKKRESSTSSTSKWTILLSICHRARSSSFACSRRIETFSSRTPYVLIEFIITKANWEKGRKRRRRWRWWDRVCRCRIRVWEQQESEMSYMKKMLDEEKNV